METLRTIWYDIRRELKQGKDDPEIPDAQGIYWVIIAADRLRMLHIQKRKSGAFLKRFTAPVIVDTEFINRQYISLPQSIYDFDMDRGIHSIAYYDPSSLRPEQAYITFARIDPASIVTRNMSEYQKARPDHPYFWREEDRVYLDGITIGDVPYVELHLYTNLPDLNELDVDDLVDQPFQFPKELLFNLKQAVLHDGRYTLSLPGEYLVNDGTNRPREQVVGKPEKTISVNDPLMNTGTTT